MIGAGIGIMQVAARGGESFDVLSLFEAGEDGAHLDPSDPLVLFSQVEMGTQRPVVGGLVRSVLCKSKSLALGSEVQPSGDLSGFTGVNSATIDSLTQATFSGNDIANRVQKAFAAVTLPYVMFGSARVTANVSCLLGVNNLYAGKNTNMPVVGQAYQVDSYMSRLYGATGTFTMAFNLGSGAPAVVTFAEVSARPVLGSHALGSDTTNVPILREAAGGFRYLEYDGADRLTLLNPDLGTNATIARATAAGAVILQNQTVGANFVDNTTHYGLVLLDRPLTAKEEAGLTAYLNRKAGL